MSTTDPTSRDQEIAQQVYTRAKALVDLQASVVQQGANLDRVVAVADSLAASVSTMAASMDNKASKREIRQWLVVLALLVFGALGGLYVRSSQNHAVLNRFTECTTPGNNPPPHTGHECYDNTLSRTAAVQLQIDCSSEALLRYYLRAIPNVPLPPIRSQCQPALVPSTGSSSPPTTTVPLG